MSDAPKKAKKAATKAYIEAIGVENLEAEIAEVRQRQQVEAFKPKKPPVTQQGLEADLSAIAQEVAKPKKIGRPSKYTPEVANKICDLLSEGTPLRAICRLDDMPDWRTVYEWIERDEAFSGRVTRAREHGVEAIAQDTLAMIDEQPRYVEDAKGGTRIDPAYIQWTKLRTEQRMKLLACWSPNRYGNRVQVAGDKENPLQVNIQTSEMFESILKNAEMTRQIEE
jgi:hypothetical protein